MNNTLAVIEFKAYLAAKSGRDPYCPFHPASKEARVWNRGAIAGRGVHLRAKKPMFTL